MKRNYKSATELETVLIGLKKKETILASRKTTIIIYFSKNEDAFITII